MTPLNRNKISLYQDAKSTLSSLVKQTTQVFIGFMIMLLLTGGNPSGFVVALTVSLGIGFVAWGETKSLNSSDIKNTLGLTPKIVQYAIDSEMRWEHILRLVSLRKSYTSKNANTATLIVTEERSAEWDSSIYKTATISRYYRITSQLPSKKLKNTKVVDGWHKLKVKSLRIN